MNLFLISNMRHNIYCYASNGRSDPSMCWKCWHCWPCLYLCAGHVGIAGLACIYVLDMLALLALLVCTLSARPNYWSACLLGNGVAETKDIPSMEPSININYPYCQLITSFYDIQIQCSPIYYVLSANCKMQVVIVFVGVKYS